MTAPKYPNFKPIELSDQEIISHHLALSERKICELNLANFIIWTDFDNSYLTLIHDNLCVLINPLTEPAYFLEPLGKNKIIETTEACLKHIGKISRASSDFISHLPHGRFHAVCIRSQFDYVYGVKDLAELKGKKYDGKRNHLKRFLKHFPDHHFVALKPDHKADAFKLFDRWFEFRKDSKFFPKLAYLAQKSALETSFNNFHRLGLSGGAVFGHDRLLGFFIGSRLNHDTIDLHFLYSDPEVQGAYQFLLRKACGKTFSSFKYINLEQDLGIPGLRQSKLSNHPVRLEQKF
ncbi:MAG: phosphatidylglycerol lysyltransferase domain-containing protein, partial [Candidatus Margulisiibacteriota bacterium]